MTRGYQPYLNSVDDAIVAAITATSPIKFDALLRQLEEQMGCNKINETVLQRRLKGLRVRRRIKHNQISPKGWVLTDERHDDTDQSGKHTNTPDDTTE